MAQGKRKPRIARKPPLTEGELRYFLAPPCTTDDYYAAIEECKERSGNGRLTTEVLALYFCAERWKELWLSYKDFIEEQWRRSLAPDQIPAQRRWACQCYHDRLSQIFRAERDREAQSAIQ